MDSTPEKTASTGSGMARYPSGIQPCSGNIGIFTRNAAAKNKKIQSWVPSSRRSCCRSLSTNVSSVAFCCAARTPVAIAAASISSDPTRV